MRPPDFPDHGVFYPPVPPVEPLRWRLALVLFLTTLLTTLAAGTMQAGLNPLEPGNLIAGAPFSLTLMTILLVHEMGHFLTARRHRVSVTLPYFIPMPITLIGTMGAFIRIRQVIPTRRALIDIGASGPLAGFVVAVAAVAVGLPKSEAVVLANFPVGETIRFGDSILIKILQVLPVGQLPEGTDLILHPMAFAGWVGLFITSVNLLPVGQLDGGHVAYAIWGERQRVVSMLVARKS